MSLPPRLPRASANPEPEVLGSAARVRPGEVRWYLPSWSERARFMGWRWLYLLPTVIVAILGILSLIVPEVGLATLQLAWVGWKLIALAVCIPIVLAARAARDSLNSRPDPFCIHCGYSLTGLPDHHRCPECGELFDFSTIQEYRRDPHQFIYRHAQAQRLPTSEHIPINSGTTPSPRSQDGT